MKKRGYQERFYRDWVGASELIHNRIIVGETDILISTDKSMESDFLTGKIKHYRAYIEDYIKKDKNFLTSLVPIDVNTDAPFIVKDMAAATKIAGVGPMAAVAGAIAQYLGQDLSGRCKEIIIENGGDIFLKTRKTRHIGVFAGDSPFSKKIRIRIEPSEASVGICTSSGTVGHSLSFGKSDATVIIAKSAILADALATRVGNIIQDASYLGKATEFLKKIDGVKGTLLIIGSSMCVWGDIKIVQ